MHGVAMAKRNGRKNKLILVREPSGKLSRADIEREYPPAQVKRLRDAAMVGMADAEWGSVAGQLFLSGRLNAPLYAAAKRWAERVSRYHDAIGAPPPNPKALDFDRKSHGTDPDPESEEGRRQAARHVNAVTDFLAAHSVLSAAGQLSEATVRSVCERNDYPVSQDEHEALNKGLLWLADYWGLTNQGKRDVR